jgi:PAS domain S-box-containing protein
MRIITTQQVNCRDCHRCMRSCPLKAIGIENGQARLLDDKCVLCGRCVTECPQHAKQVMNQLSAVTAAIADGRTVVLSLAPSFVAAFPEYQPAELIALLAGLGFATVEETAVGAEIVSEFYSRLLHSADKPVISACCPVAVAVVKKYYPSLVDNLAPVASPMQAHAHLLRQRFGEDAFIVFAGPCIGKLAEGRETVSQVDAVITFEQLKDWLASARPAAAPPAVMPTVAPGNVRYYPIPGGILKSFVQSESTATDIIAVDGLDNCMEVFDSLLKGEIAPRFVEALACAGGCINGPVSGRAKASPAKRLKVAEFAVAGSHDPFAGPPSGLDFARRHVADPFEEYQPSEAEIREVLKLTGKLSKQDEKNCGACGYDTCREKAIAVCQGLTEIDTCVPYMRSKAESLANFIVEYSLNAIVVVNKDLVIQEFNPAAEQLFGRSKETVKGSRLSRFMDCGAIEAAAATGKKSAGKRVEMPALRRVGSQNIIPLPEHDLIIVAISDITEQEKQARELEQIKLQTVEKASEIINKQMQVAQEIAGLLGETTAETKAALLELVGLLNIKGKN